MMTVEKDKVVTLQYELYSEGNMVEQTSKEHPLVFLFGAGNMLASFENNLAGKAIGDSFDFELAAKDAYGEWNSDHIYDLPKENFIQEGHEDLLEIGAAIQLQDESGHVLVGTVKEIGDDTVKVDLNHEMAGKDLHFKGEITAVRDAQPEELSHGHVHGPGGHEH